MIPETVALRHLLAVRGCLRARPAGTSMLPTLFPGEEITLAPPGHIRVGDLVLVDGPRLHRVIALDRERGLVTTRGDALAAADDPVTLDRVLAVVVAVRPVLRRRLLMLARRGLARAAHRVWKQP